MSTGVAAYHEELTRRTMRVLGDELVGVYAMGSVVLGGYEPGRSDLDVTVVTRERVSTEVKAALVAALRHEALPCPARGLELVVYPLSVARGPTAEAGFDLDLNTGARMPFRAAFDDRDAARHWYVIDRSILSERGAALAGPPAGVVFAPLPRALVVEALVDGLRWHASSEDSRGDDAVLNACRSLRYALEEHWSNKREAGAWALGHVADTTLVEAALRSRESGEALPAGRVARFLRDVEARLAAA